MANEEISQLTNYTPALDADVIPIVDTANATTTKITWANIKTTLKTYFDTLYLSITGSAAKTNAINSATTVVNVSSAAAPSSSQVLTATDSTHATWQTPSAGAVIPAMIIATAFDGVVGKYNANLVGSGTASTGAATGAQITTTATVSSGAWLQWNVAGVNSTMILGNPILTFNVNLVALNAASGAGSMYYGFCQVSMNGAGHTFTGNHIGFKIIKSGGVVSLFATQGDGSTENASAALTTVADGDILDLILKVNGTASVDYYWRKNGGTLSAATNLTTNFPVSANSGVQLSTCNDATAFTFSASVGGVSYQR